MGGAPPRIIALDDYFMVEHDKEVKDPESGRIVIKKVQKEQVLSTSVSIN